MGTPRPRAAHLRAASLAYLPLSAHAAPSGQWAGPTGQATDLLSSKSEEIKELEAQVLSLKKDLEKRHEGKSALDKMLSVQQSPNDKSGLGFNSNNKNKSKSKSNKKKGQDKVKDPAKLVCFKCKVEGHHVRSCPLKKKKHLSEKQKGKWPQGRGQAHARPQFEDRPLVTPQNRRKLRQSAAAGDKDRDLQINWSGTNSIRLGMMTRATRRSSRRSRLGNRRSGTTVRRWTAAVVLFRCSQRLEKKVRKKKESGGGQRKGRWMRAMVSEARSRLKEEGKSGGACAVVERLGMVMPAA
ncbi:hypothetical protein QYE76_041711 [Lolium multiflorum]|uniref:CCHC-type domain-containing protein n=1 Tax=Lolium multiflorum TaxID=4521 RepID=A0AAD8TF96_LOLMU|nr:hypothetical protein QYE76_041711 [Lolium multiflorum]